MDTKNMKNTKNTVFKWILGACILLAGVQNAFAECKGTVVLQPPAWDKLYVYFANEAVEITDPRPASGYMTINLNNLGLKTGTQDDSFSFTNSTSVDYPLPQTIDGRGYDTTMSARNGTIQCPGSNAGVNEIIYVYEDPTVKGKTVISKNPPHAKYLFMMIPPEYVSWLSSDPMISMDGGVTGKKLTADPDRCGWYGTVWFDEPITDSVVFYSAADKNREEVIGMNGNWEEGASATLIPLNMLFEYVDTLYFVPDQDQLPDETSDGWFFHADEVEGIEGKCSYELAAIIYDTDASLHGAFTCATTYYKDMPAAEGRLNGCPTAAPFSYPAGQPTPCIGVTQGIVEDILGPNKKPIYKPSSGCFVSEEAFNTMFISDSRYNETYCVEMPFSRSDDGKWEFDSDNYTSPGATAKGGFYPGENPIPAQLMSAPNPAAHNKRKAEGPVFMESALRMIDTVEGVPLVDILCNGPGWTKGMDCNGQFSGGSEWNKEVNGITLVNDGWQWSVMGDGWANDVAPKNWTFYKEGTEIAVKVASTQGGYGTGNSARWASGGWVKDDQGKAKVQAYDGTVFTDGSGRNQHFCFESHANFVFREGLRFSFRGDDDIWVFIDNKLAVDIGGTHLAAPGYVNLDTFIGQQGKLEEGKTYDIDIFFCDRRTTMSNVRIKTNMYIMQKTDISVNSVQGAPGVTSYDICYTQSGDGSCAAAISGNQDNVTYCGDEILNAGLDIKVTLVTGTKMDSTKVVFVANTPGVYKGGIDLTNLTNPKVNKKQLTLGGGRYSLFITIDGKTEKVMTFRQTGEVDVVYRDGIAKDSNNVAIPRGNYDLIKSAMGGELVPVYISSVAEPEAGTSGKLDIFPTDAVDVVYTLDPDATMRVFYWDAEKEEYNRLASGESRKIGPSGIDTVYVTVPLDDLDSAIKDFSIGVKGRTNRVSIKFYLPMLKFVDAPDPGTYAPVPGDNPETPEFEERFTEVFHTFYVAVLRPDETTGAYGLCTDCNFPIRMFVSKVINGVEVRTSEGIDFSEDSYGFTEGFATIMVRSRKPYRYDFDAPSMSNPALFGVQAENDAIYALYTPAYFRPIPVPAPGLADVFDTKGGAIAVEAPKIDPSFVKEDYLDGVGDSVAIYYNRRIHKDSLPSAICIVWDSASAETINPFKQGLSTMPSDSLKPILCNVIVEGSEYIKCSNVDAEGYCDSKLGISGLTLSEGVKTAGSGHIYSFAEYLDRNRVVRSGFECPLVDRIAPVPLSGKVISEKNSDGELIGYDKMTVYLSEPVKLLATGSLNSMDFYLNSASDLDPLDRFASAAENTTRVVSSSAPPVYSDSITITYTTGSGVLTPHSGDYVRLGGNLANPVWQDLANITAITGSDTTRDPSDAMYYWNSPTGYKDNMGRVPSPWILLNGDAIVDILDVNFAHSESAVHCKNNPDPNVACNTPITVYTVGSQGVSDSAAIGGLWGLPGHFVKSDMQALYLRFGEVDPENFYFSYDVSYFTNLGAYVAGESGKIYCDDAKNMAKYNKAFFGGDGKTCMDKGFNFFIAWNMESDKGRKVGTGAYIVKINTYVKIGDSKENKQEETSMFGIRESNVPYRYTWDDFKKNNY